MRREESMGPRVGLKFVSVKESVCVVWVRLVVFEGVNEERRLEAGQPLPW